MGEGGQRGEVVEVLLVDEHGPMGAGQPVEALLGRRIRVLDAQEAGDRLLFEPFAHVALGGAGAASQLDGRGVAVVGEGPIEAEPAAQMDRSYLEGADHRSEEPLDERIGGARGRRRLGLGHGLGHGGSPSRLGREGSQVQQPIDASSVRPIALHERPVPWPRSHASDRKPAKGVPTSPEPAIPATRR